MEELRRQHRDLLKKYHPDCPNGSTEATQEINAEYEKLFKLLKDKHESTQSSNTNDNKASYENMRWAETKNEMLREMLSNMIHFTGQWYLDTPQNLIKNIVTRGIRLAFGRIEISYNTDKSFTNIFLRGKRRSGRTC